MDKQEIINVRAKSYSEFSLLIDLVYSIGYKFDSGKKRHPFMLWFFMGCDGLSLYPDHSVRFVEASCNIDSVDVKEYLLLIHGQI
jgi:hypothetical protein